MALKVFAVFCVLILMVLVVPEAQGVSIISIEKKKELETEFEEEWDRTAAERLEKWEALARENARRRNRCTTYNKKWVKCYRDKLTGDCWYGWKKVCPHVYEAMLRDWSLIPWYQDARVPLEARYTPVFAHCECNANRTICTTVHTHNESYSRNAECLCFKDMFSPSFGPCFPTEFSHGYTNGLGCSNCSAANICTPPHIAGDYGNEQNSTSLNDTDLIGYETPCLCSSNSSFCVRNPYDDFQQIPLWPESRNIHRRNTSTNIADWSIDNNSVIASINTIMTDVAASQNEKMSENESLLEETSDTVNDYNTVNEIDGKT